MIVLDNVSKTYRSLRGPEVRAVSNVSLEIRRGEVLGIAGPNGAGKSTLIAMLLGFLSPDEGRLTIEGLAPRAYVERHGVAYLPELMTVPLHWRTDEALRRMAILAGIPADRRAAEVERVIGSDIEFTADVAGLNAGLAAAITAGALITSVGPAESSLEEAFRSAVTQR